MAVKQIESDSIKGKFYEVDTTAMTCTCVFFKYNKQCKHLTEAMASEGVDPQSQSKLVILPSGNKEQAMRLKAYDDWTRTRVSKNFLLRDFMYSSTADYFGVSNKPSDMPEQVVASAKALCEILLEPILAKFGRFFITYGYQSRKIMDALFPPKSPTSSSPHQWDRGTYGTEIYARIDIVPLCVLDGEVAPEDFINWLIYNTPVDLVMFWRQSSTFCLTISPKPRRVALEWVRKGKGENGSNRITYFGTHFWQNVYPTMVDEDKPKFAPSSTGGAMY